MNCTDDDDFVSGPHTHPKLFDEYCTYSEVLVPNHFCYVIDEVTTDSSSCSSYETSITSRSSESDMESSNEIKRTVTRKRYHGYRPPGVPSCIVEQKEDGISSESEEEKFHQQADKNRCALKEMREENKYDWNYKPKFGMATKFIASIQEQQEHIFDRKTEILTGPTPIPSCQENKQRNKKQDFLKEVKDLNRCYQSEEECSGAKGPNPEQTVHTTDDKEGCTNFQQRSSDTI